ncbi:hypothetical protein D3C71_1491080 [compost metagenome]
MQHLVLVHDAQAAQHLVKQRADRRLAENLGLFQVTRGHDEILQGGTLQVVHDHVDRLVLAKEVVDADYRGMGDLRERPPLFEKTLETQAVQR